MAILEAAHKEEQRTNMNIVSQIAICASKAYFPTTELTRVQEPYILYKESY